jgi:5-methylcytosine-specific restriction endonuclease McrA
VLLTVRVDRLAPRRVARRRIRPAERKYIWGQTGGRCYMCKEELPFQSSWHMEHVLAFSSDPARHDVLGNMLAACATCNRKKLDRPLEQVRRPLQSGVPRWGWRTCWAG